MWPVFAAKTEVSSDEPWDTRLEQKLLQHLRLRKPQPIYIADQTQLRCHVEIRADIRQIQARVHKVRLPLNLAAAQVRHEAESLHQIHAEQFDLLPIPIAELPAGKVRIVNDRVEPRT